MFENFVNCQSCEHNPTGDKCEYFGLVIGMHGCSSGVERKPRNHFEEIKAMGMEELAEFLEEEITRNPHCKPEKDCTNDDSCIPCWLEWLKEEVSE